MCSGSDQEYRIPFDRALEFANKEKITEILYPLFVHNVEALLYKPLNQAGVPIGDSAMTARSRYKVATSNSPRVSDGSPSVVGESTQNRSSRTASLFTADEERPPIESLLREMYTRIQILQDRSLASYSRRPGSDTLRNPAPTSHNVPEFPQISVRNDKSRSGLWSEHCRSLPSTPTAGSWNESSDHEAHSARHLGRSTMEIRRAHSEPPSRNASQYMGQGSSYHRCHAGQVSQASVPGASRQDRASLTRRSRAGNQEHQREYRKRNHDDDDADGAPPHKQQRTRLNVARTLKERYPCVYNIGEPGEYSKHVTRYEHISHLL